MAVNHFRDYYQEKVGGNIEEFEHGFIIYTLFEDQGIAHIDDIFITPKRRREGLGRNMFLFIQKKLKSLGFKTITCNCVLDYKNSEESLKAILSQGFKFLDVHQEGSLKIMKLYKEIK